MECLLLSVPLELFRIRTVRKLEIENSPKQFPVEKWCRSKEQLIIIMITRPEFFHLHLNNNLNLWKLFPAFTNTLQLGKVKCWSMYVD